MTPAPPRAEVAPTGRRSTVQRLLASPLGAFPLVALAFSLLVGARRALGAAAARARRSSGQVSSRLLVTRDACDRRGQACGSAPPSARLRLAMADASGARRACASASRPTAACDLSALVGSAAALRRCARFRDIDPRRSPRAQCAATTVHGLDPAAAAGARALAAERLADERGAVLPAVLDAGQPAPVDRRSRRARRRARRACCCSSCRSRRSTRCSTSRAPGRAARPTRSTRRGASSRRAASPRSCMHAGPARGHERQRGARASTLRDPGVDLTRRLARGVAARPAAADAHGARRGRRRRRRGRDGLPRLPRRAAWWAHGRWLPEFGIGVATEVDHAEAFAAHRRCCIACSAALLAILRAVLRVAARRRRCSWAGCATARCARRASPSASASTASCASSARAAWAPCTWPITSCSAAGGDQAGAPRSHDARRRSRASSARCSSPARCAIRTRRRLRLRPHRGRARPTT